MSVPYTITSVRSEEDLEDAKRLFYLYADSLGFDLDFQRFDDEMTSMPGKYAPPKGELLLARDGQGEAIGCAALRPISQDCCEMKRLYVLPAAQGLGLGRTLATAVIAKAEGIGYREMKLDTLPSMVAAVRMYHAFGFVEIPAYYDTPMQGTMFLSLALPRQIEQSAKC